jgi:hypothetical protein
MKIGRPPKVDDAVIDQWKKAIAKYHNLTAKKIF